MKGTHSSTPRSGLSTTPRSIESLLAAGYQVGGVLRIFRDGAEPHAHHFTAAVEQALAAGKDVFVVAHSMGEDWLYRPAPSC